MVYHAVHRNHPDPKSGYMTANKIPASWLDLILLIGSEVNISISHMYRAFQDLQLKTILRIAKFNRRYELFCMSMMINNGKENTSRDVTTWP